MKKKLLKKSIQFFFLFQILQIGSLALWYLQNLYNWFFGIFILGLIVGISNYILNPYNIKDDKL